MWCSHDLFHPCVGESWNQPFVGFGLLRLCLVVKLKRVKIALRYWNKLVFGHVDQTIKLLEGNVEFLDHQL